MSSPKILMFGWEFPPYNSGGLGVACLGLTQALVKQGAEVTFVLPKKFDFHYDHMRFIFADTKTVINKKNYVYYLRRLGAYSRLFPEHQGKISSQNLNNTLNPKKVEKLTKFHFDSISGVGFEINQNSVYSENNETVEENSNLAEVALDLHNPDFGNDIYSEVMKYAILSEKIIRSENFDIIHCHDWLTVESGILAKKLTGKPLIFHVHATEIDRTGGHVNQLIYDIERKGLLAADRVVAVSEFTKRTIANHYGINENKIVVVHNGIDYYLEKSGEKDEELISNLNQMKNFGTKFVTFIGRLTFQKGVEYFLEAAKIVSGFLPEVKFLIAGSGDLETNLLKRTAELGLSGKVMFPGFLRDEKLKALYAVSDLFVMPSVNEPFGLVALEALTHETPVIISKNSGVAEVLVHSLKVDFWDVEDMASLILSVLKHKSLHQNLLEFGHREVQRLSWDQAARKFLGIYNSAEFRF